MAKKPSQPESIGDVLRARRVEVLKKGLREMARQLDIAPAHLTDLETGRRSPSEELLVRLAQAYGVPVAELRAGWKKAEPVVSEVATQDPTTAEKSPVLFRAVRDLSPKQWDEVIEFAKSRAKSQRKGGEGP